MANKDICVGSNVELSKDTEWEIGIHNPIGVRGTVIEIDSWVYVEWENGSSNSYELYGDDLIAIEVSK